MSDAALYSSHRERGVETMGLGSKQTNTRSISQEISGTERLRYSMDVDGEERWGRKP